MCKLFIEYIFWDSEIVSLILGIRLDLNPHLDFLGSRVKINAFFSVP